MTSTGFYSSTGGTPDNLTFGSSFAAAPTASAEDNDTFIVTDTGDALGVVEGVYKFDKGLGTWKSIDLDTDVSAVNTTLSGTNLTVSVTEDGVTLSSIADLSLIADTDVSGVAVSAGPTSTAATPTFQVTVTEDGVSVNSNEYPFPLVVCPAPMTRAALRAMRSAGNLTKDCHYVMTDYNRGTVGAATILLHAIDANTLSMGVQVKTTFDTLAWDGRYDINTNRLENLSDNIGNEVTGNGSIDGFPWGVTTVTDNQVKHGSLNYTSGTVTGVTIGKASTLNMLGGTLTETDILGDSDVTIRSGSNYNNVVAGSSYLNQVGTGYIRGCTFANESTVTVGDVNHLETEFKRTTSNTTGAAGSIAYSELTRSSISALNVPSFNLFSSVLGANSQVAVNGATRTYLTHLTMMGYGRIIQSADTQLDSNYTSVGDYAYIQVTQGRLYASYNTLSNVGYIQHASSGTNRCERCTVSVQSTIRFLGTANGCRVYYSTVSSGSTIYCTGASSGCYFYYCEVSSSSYMYASGSTNLRCYYGSNSGNSEYSSVGMTGTHYAYYNVMAARGYLRHRNAAGGRFYAIHNSSQGLLQITGVNANVYYSSFVAYFYLYLTASNISGTRTGLHGYGRRSYTPPAPIPNGTYTQNF